MTISSHVVVSSPERNGAAALSTEGGAVTVVRKTERSVKDEKIL